MPVEFRPILLKYEGLDAARGLIDLGQLGQSVQGASKLLGVAGNLVATGQYVKKAPALSVRVMVASPARGSYDLPAILMTLAAPAAPMFPIIADLGQKAATKAVEGLVNYVLAKFSGKSKEAEMAFSVADTALKEMGQTSRTAIEAVERMASNQRPAARLFAVPVGASVSTAQIGNAAHGAIQIDAEARAVIDAAEPVEIGDESVFDVLISELDLVNKSCKLSLQPDDTDDHRIPGEITDPLLLTPNNPYSEAFAAQAWIRVKGKPELSEGDIQRSYISDLGRR